MAPAANVDLYAPFEKDVILEVRSSKMKTMPGLSVQSGIDKLVREGRVPVSLIGIDDDEHDLVFHGGPDKAILGCKQQTIPPFPFPPFSSHIVTDIAIRLQLPLP